jgi:hypothetical protein
MHKHYHQFEVAQEHLKRVIEIDRLLDHPDLNADLSSLAYLQTLSNIQSA